MASLKGVTFLASMEQLEQLEASGGASHWEVILSCREISRFGSLTTLEAQQLAQAAKERGYKTILEWDIIMTESRFAVCRLLFSQMNFDFFDALRVQDVGALNFAIKLAQEHSHLKLHLNLETGNHNFLAVARWIDYVEQKRAGLLERLILSYEIPLEKIQEITAQLLEKVEIELLGLGRILLFYTPRSLVSPLKEESDLREQDLHALAHSQEGPHSHFPLLENTHGTFMFNTKDLSLLKFVDQLVDCGVKFLRIDNRFDDNSHIIEVLGHGRLTCSVEADVKKYWPRPLIQGFFRSNRSDVLFKKLKNSRLQERDDSLIGEVVEVVKKKHVLVYLRDLAPSYRDQVRLGAQLLIKTPDGKEKQLTLKSLYDVSGREIEKIEEQKVIAIPPVHSASVRSQVFLLESDKHV